MSLGRALDFLAHFADPLAYFVNSVVHRSTSTLCGTAGTRATHKDKRGEEEKEWFHHKSFKHDAAGQLKLELPD